MPCATDYLVRVLDHGVSLRLGRKCRDGQSSDHVQQIEAADGTDARGRVYSVASSVVSTFGTPFLLGESDDALLSACWADLVKTGQADRLLSSGAGSW